MSNELVSVYNDKSSEIKLRHANVACTLASYSMICIILTVLSATDTLEKNMLLVVISCDNLHRSFQYHCSSRAYLFGVATEPRIWLDLRLSILSTAGG